MRSITFAAIAAFSLCLVGCAANGPKYEGPTALAPESSEIVVYRPDRFARGANTFHVYLDGKEVATLQNAGFTIVTTLPGSHELEIRSWALDFAFKPTKISVNTTAGNRLFARFEPYVSGPLFVTPYGGAIPVAFKFALVAEPDALIELQTLRRSE